jgi:hypothetical protein
MEDIFTFSGRMHWVVGVGVVAGDGDWLAFLLAVQPFWAANFLNFRSSSFSFWAFLAAWAFFASLFAAMAPCLLVREGMVPALGEELPEGWLLEIRLVSLD